MTTKPNMFIKGAAYGSIESFIADYQDSHGSRYCFWNHKLMHVNFVAGMHLISLISAINQGSTLFRAIRNPEYIEPVKAAKQ